MRTTFGPLVAVAAMALAAGAASAHHSTALYDLGASRTLQVTVKSFQWANPHNYVQVIVQGANGATTEWAIEAGTPATATRQGWSKATLKSGDKVTMIVAPMRDGRPEGTLKTVMLPNGTSLNSVAADPRATKPFDALPNLKRATP